MDNPIDFWKANHAAGMQALALIPGEEDVVLIVADTRDSMADMVVSAFAEKEGMDLASYREKTLAKEMIPTAHLVMGRDDARRMFEELDHPGIAKTISATPPAPGVWVLLMMVGHISCLVTRRQPIVAIGSA